MKRGGGTAIPLKGDFQVGRLFDCRREHGTSNRESEMDGKKAGRGKEESLFEQES